MIRVLIGTLIPAHAKESSPAPYPSPTGLDVSKVTPGYGGAIIFVFLVVALVLLLLSMNRHLKKVNFDEESTRQ